MTCLNCQTEFESKNCPACGQKAATERITFRQVFKEIRHHFIHFDEGYALTMKELALRPGAMLRGYLAGKRSKFIKPIRFLLWMTTINFLIFHWTGMGEIMLQKINSDTQKSQVLAQKLTAYLFDHPTIIQFLMVPCVAFFAWLTLRRRGQNFAEHIVITSYLLGEIALASVVTMPMMWLLHFFMDVRWVSPISMLIWVAYQGWVYNQFYQFRHRATGFLRAAGILLAAYFMLILVSILVVSVVIYFFKPQIELWIQQGQN